MENGTNFDYWTAQYNIIKFLSGKEERWQWDTPNYETFI